LICAGFCAAVSPSSQGQTAPTAPEIRVRLLNYKTGRPMKGRYVQLTLFDPDGQLSSDAALMKGKTGADGIAAFRLKTKPAPRIAVVALDDYPCTEPEEFKADGILLHGIVGSFADIPYCKPHTSSLPNPQPGEVVFYVHRLNLWQRIRRSIEE
jgi:hypothetical protein